MQLQEDKKQEMTELQNKMDEIMKKIYYESEYNIVNKSVEDIEFYENVKEKLKINQNKDNDSDSNDSDDSDVESE